MWLDKLKELKKEKGMSTKQIAEKAMLPEKTISRIFSGETDNPYVATIQRIASALGAYLDDIFADTKVVVATETIVEVQENANAYEAENIALKSEITALAHEIELLRIELKYKDELIKHKDEILEWHRFYNNRK